MVNTGDTLADSGVMGSAGMVLNLPRFGRSANNNPNPTPAPGDRKASADSRSTSSGNTGHTRAAPKPSNAPPVRLKKGFFGRSKVDPPKRPNTSASSHSSNNDQQDRPSQISPRPSNNALFSTEPGLRSTVGSDSSRDAIFSTEKGRSRGNSTTSKQPRPPSRADLESDATPPSSCETVPVIEDTSKSELALAQETLPEANYNGNLRKQNLSSSSGSHHAKHSALYQLPPLETVEEKERSSGFWSPATHARASFPRKYLNAVDMEDLSKNFKDLGATGGSISSQDTANKDSNSDSEQHVVSPADEGLDSLNETTFDERTQTRFDPDDGARRLQPTQEVAEESTGSRSNPAELAKDTKSSRHSKKNSKRYSCISVVDAQWQPDKSTLRLSDSIEEDDTFEDYNLDRASYKPKITAHISNVADIPAIPGIHEDSDTRTEDDDATPDAERPLPSPAMEEPTTKSSTYAKRHSSLNPNFRISQINPPDQPTSPTSKHSSHSSHWTHKSKAYSSTVSDAPVSMVWSDATWEDDIDYIYEQEAEATCDFDWAFDHAGEPAVHNDGEFSLPVTPLLDQFPSVPHEMAKGAPQQGRMDTIAEQPYESQLPPTHGRAASIGHRGFLAARKGSADSDKPQRTPAALSLAPNYTHVGGLSPILDAAEESGPSSPAKDRNSGGNASTSSDPEGRDSTSSRHRKSSSYGSYESITRPAGTKDTNRWSVANLGTSSPLGQNRAKNRSSVSKKTISLPLESLPQEGIEEEQQREATGDPNMDIPSSYQTGRSSFVMRRPQTSGDRAILQAAGRAVQRYRPGTPGRQTHTPDPTITRMAPPATPAAGPNWI